MVSAALPPLRVSVSPWPPPLTVSPAAPIVVWSMAPNVSRPPPPLTVVARPEAVLVTLMVSAWSVALRVRLAKPL